MFIKNEEPQPKEQPQSRQQYTYTYTCALLCAIDKSIFCASTCKFYTMSMCFTQCEMSLKRFQMSVD